MKRISHKQITHLDPNWIKNKIESFLREDAPYGDITSGSIIAKEKKIHAKMISADDLVFCGKAIIPYCFPDSCNVKVHFEEGASLKTNQIIADIHGPAIDVLTCERVTLNLIQRLCGISTETKRYISLKLPKGFKVMDTRKMTPGLRKFEKYAVQIGGGWNHRLDLSSAVLIKDNHIQTAGGIKQVFDQLTLKNIDNLPIELEVDTIDQIIESLSMKIDGYLLDNMSPKKVKKAVQIIRDQPDGNSIFIEASGGIDYNNLEEYASAGVDGVSMSAITTKAPVPDIKLEFN